MKLSSVLAAVALVALPVFVGCAAPAEEEDPTSETGAAISASAPITADNYMAHPKTWEIIQLLYEVDAIYPRLEHDVRDWLCQDGPGDRHRELDHDGASVRRLILQSVNGSSTERQTFTYDRFARIRFADVVTGDSSSTEEVVTFFATDGTRLLELHRTGRLSASSHQISIADQPFTPVSTPRELVDALKNPVHAYMADATCL